MGFAECKRSAITRVQRNSKRLPSRRPRQNTPNTPLHPNILLTGKLNHTATIHIPEAEAARDLPGLLARVRATPKRSSRAVSSARPFCAHRLHAANGLLNTFTINSNGQPGDVQTHLFTRVGSSQQRTELLAKDTHDDHNGGDHPWSIANGDASTLLLYNSTSQPQQFQVRISGAGSSWLQLFQLAAFETKAVAINDIIVKGTPDYKGHILPANLTAGEVQWSTDFGATGLGRLLVTNTKSALARNFSCPQYFNLCTASFGAFNFGDVPLGGNIDLSTINVGFCSTYNPSSCTGPSVGQTNSYTTYWQGANNGMTQMVGSTNTYIALKGVSAGDFNIYATAVSGSCQTQPMGGGGTVQVPASLPIATDRYDGPNTACTGTSHGRILDVYRQLTDTTGAAILIAGENVAETVTIVTNGLGIPTPPSKSGSTLGGAQIGQIEDLFSFCTPSCPGNATTVLSQAIKDTSANVNLKTYTITYSCTGITVQ